MPGTDRSPNAAHPSRLIARVIELLNCFTLASPRLSLQELSERLNLHRSTVHRLATQLCEAGYLEHDRSAAKYQLGLKLFELGAVVLHGIDLLAQSRSHLEKLRDGTEETVHLGILDHDEVLYLAKFDSPRPLKLSSPLGSRRAAHCTSLGKVLLAYQDEDNVRRILREHRLQPLTSHTITDPERLVEQIREVRQRGYAVDDEETEVGLRCLAVPVRDHRGDVIASVGISGPTPRLTDLDVPRLVASVRETAEAISRDLGWGLSAPWPSSS